MWAGHHFIIIETVMDGFSGWRLFRLLLTDNTAIGLYTRKYDVEALYFTINSPGSNDIFNLCVRSHNCSELPRIYNIHIQHRAGWAGQWVDKMLWRWHSYPIDREKLTYSSILSSLKSVSFVTELISFISRVAKHTIKFNLDNPCVYHSAIFYTLRILFVPVQHRSNFVCGVMFI